MSQCETQSFKIELEQLSQKQVEKLPEKTTNNYAVNMMQSFHVEVTTNIGCPVGCLKYCPQEVITKRYDNRAKVMSFEVFKKCLANVPRNVGVLFSGFSEPFANPNCIEMIKYAHSSGHPLGLATTLWGASKQNVAELRKMKYDIFVLHLPDGTAMHEPKTPNYRDNVFELFSSVIPNLEVMNMNNNSKFKTNNRENVVRGKLPKPRKFGHCTKLDYPQPVLLPSGEMYLCCMDFGLEHKVGDLSRETFMSIAKRIQSNKGNYYRCQYCEWNFPAQNRITRVCQSYISGLLNMLSL